MLRDKLKEIVARITGPLANFLSFVHTAVTVYCLAMSLMIHD